MLTKLYPMVQFKKDTWEIDEFDCASMFLLIGTEKAMLIDCGIGDGTSDIAVFRPGRTQATYDFLSVIHDKVGEVTVTLPLGSYHIAETKPPYGFTGTKQSYDVTFQWDEQTNSCLLYTS